MVQGAATAPARTDPPAMERGAGAWHPVHAKDTPVLCSDNQKHVNVRQ